MARPALQFPKSSGIRAWLARHTRTALGGLIIAGVAILAAGAAAVAALAALAIVAIFAVLGSLVWLFSRVRRPAAYAPPSSPRTLDARHTASGWTVDALGRFGG